VVAFVVVDAAAAAPSLQHPAVALVSAVVAGINNAVAFFSSSSA
jgi:hypothetical protein